MRSVALICALLAAFFAAFAYGSNGKTLLTPEERLWLEQNQSRIVLAVEIGYAPFVFLDPQGKPTGLAHDYLRLIESKLGVSFKQQQFSSLNDIFEKVRVGDVHIVNAVTKTPERLQFLSFTEPFISVPNVILVRNDHSGQFREEGLSGLTVSLVRSYAITEYLTGKALGLVPDLVPDDLTALLNVSFGRSDAAIIDLATASYLISQKGITNLRVAGEVGLPVELAIATPVNSPVLHSILEKGLAAITAGERESIHKRWISISNPGMLADWRMWIALGGVLLAIIATITVTSIWNNTLRRQVKERTAELEKERSYFEQRVQERTAELARSEAQLRSNLENTPNVAIQWYDETGRVIYWNPASERLFGWTAAEAIGKTLDALILSPEGAAQFLHLLGEIRQSGQPHGPYEVAIHTRNGREVWILSTTFAIPIEGDRLGFVCMDVDITERKQAEEKINELAFFDQLTGLPNRTLLLDRLRQIMTAGNRNETYGAVLFIDLDHFKTLNDTLGHDQGDLLLLQVAQRLPACLREGDTVARLGGDEFVVVLGSLDGSPMEAATQTEIIGEKILAALNNTYRLDNIEYRSTASIGATLFKGHQTSIDDLLKQADLAMYKSKESGRNALRFFDQGMQTVVVERVALEADLRRAIQEHQFLLHYQAQVQADGEHFLTGVEVLVRWQHPLRGMVSPADFIPLAEETGLILPLGRWVLETACAQLVLWAARPEMAHLTVAVNVSARQFRHPDFVDQVLTVLKDSGAYPQRLKIELTESLLVSNVEEVIEKMFTLKAMGVGFSLDDFGTGYSSLSYLKRLPLDHLKIDQSFVHDVLSDPNDAAIARTIVTLAHSLGLGVIAEGVETEAQRDFLASAGCHAYQGHLFSRPLPIEDFEQFARRA